MECYTLSLSLSLSLQKKTVFDCIALALVLVESVLVPSISGAPGLSLAATGVHFLIVQAEFQPQTSLTARRGYFIFSDEIFSTQELTTILTV